METLETQDIWYNIYIYILYNYLIILINKKKKSNFITTESTKIQFLKDIVCVSFRVRLANGGLRVLQENQVKM